MREPFRIQPALPATAYKTYQISSPVQTHFRDGTCIEAQCGAYANGWITRVDERTSLGQGQAQYIRRDSKRKFVESKLEDGTTEFWFEAGQKCFASHKIRLDREEFYLVRPGDWRGNPTGERPRRHLRAETWLEDFTEHQNRVADARNKG